MTNETMHRDKGASGKTCRQCLEFKPLAEFSGRSGRRSGRRRRRGVCRECRRKEWSGAAASPALPAPAASGPAAADAAPGSAPAVPLAAVPLTPAQPAGMNAAGLAIPDPGAAAPESGAETAEAPAADAPKPKRKRRRRKRKKAHAANPAAPSAHSQPQALAKARPVKLPVDPPPAPAGLRPTKQGFVRMLGKSDNGRRWYQEIEPELAFILVRERAAVVASRHTIRRLYSNKEFRRLILERDKYTCYFCGQYGDTIDHLLPRAKGGHTTPVNCVCACNLCNQSKADRDLDEFIRASD
ncbi:HNH endonuclease [Paenibacillus pasadenensis]|uniref:HNH endonuclease n=2 Tax=Paenibacillus pasadenensis TaxID=217090 RepID=UPI0005BBE1E7|nr:HNH endonuclease [Paenibacillus pasadenensis]